MEKIVVYILNNNTFYLKMAINSISMLRKHNNKIKILCLATEAIKIPENLNVMHDFKDFCSKLCFNLSLTTPSLALLRKCTGALRTP